MIKYTQPFLQKLEDVLGENDYQIRNERGNFKSGYCILQDKRVVVINKFAPIESRVNTLIEILKELDAREQLSVESISELKKTSVI